MQKAVDEIVISSNEFYIDFTSVAMIVPKNEINFHDIQEDQAIKFFEFGINLIYGGLMPDLLELSMQNAYEIIMESCAHKENTDIIRLQLLYVRKAIHLLHVGELEHYMAFLSQISSNIVNIAKYTDFFQKRLNESLKAHATASEKPAGR